MFWVFENIFDFVKYHSERGGTGQCFDSWQNESKQFGVNKLIWNLSAKCKECVRMTRVSSTIGSHATSNILNGWKRVLRLIYVNKSGGINSKTLRKIDWQSHRRRPASPAQVDIRHFEHTVFHIHTANILATPNKQYTINRRNRLMVHTALLLPHHQLHASKCALCDCELERIFSDAALSIQLDERDFYWFDDLSTHRTL